MGKQSSERTLAESRLGACDILDEAIRTANQNLARSDRPLWRNHGTDTNGLLYCRWRDVRMLLINEVLNLQPLWKLSLQRLDHSD